MFRIIAALSILCAGCVAKEQPEWAKTVAAYEVPLPTEEEKGKFLALLKVQARAGGFHVDAAKACGHLA